MDDNVIEWQILKYARICTADIYPIARRIRALKTDDEGIPRAEKTRRIHIITAITITKMRSNALDRNESRRDETVGLQNTFCNDCSICHIARRRNARSERAVVHARAEHPSAVGANPAGSKIFRRYTRLFLIDHVRPCRGWHVLLSCLVLITGERAIPFGFS